MALNALAANEVLLGSYRLPIKGKVNLTRLNQFPGKVTIGKTSRTDQTVADEWTQDEWKAGKLQDEYLQTNDAGRFWFSTADTLRRRKMVLPPQVYDQGNPAGTGSSSTILGIYFNGDFYAVVGTTATNCKLYKQTGGTGSWSASLGTICTSPDFVTSAIVFNNALYLAYGSGYAKLTSGGVFTASVATTPASEKASYFCLYDTGAGAGALSVVKVDSAGKVIASSDGTTWNATYTATAGNRTITGICSYVDVNDNIILEVQHTRGQAVADITNNSVRETSLQVLDSPDNGKNTVVWSDGMLYYPSGLAVWKYPKSGQIVNVGLDREDGLPTWVRGRISSLTRHPNFLITTLNAPSVTMTTPEGVFFGDFGQGTFGTFHLPPVNNAGFSAVEAYNNQGWHTLFLSGQQSYGINFGVLTTAFNNERRFYFNDGPNVKYILLPEGNYDPTKDGNYHFAPTGYHLTSWFDSGQPEIRKVATSLKFRTRNVTSTETIDVYYALNNNDDTYTYVGTINDTTVSSSGVTTMKLASGAGISFYTIRLKFVFNRGTDDTKSPMMIFFNLRHKKKPDSIFGWTFSVFGTDLAHLELVWKRLQELSDNDTLLPFAFRSDDDILHYVEIANISGFQYAGNDTAAGFTVAVVQIEKDS